MINASESVIHYVALTANNPANMFEVVMNCAIAVKIVCQMLSACVVLMLTEIARSYGHEDAIIIPATNNPLGDRMNLVIFSLYGLRAVILTCYLYAFVALMETLLSLSVYEDVHIALYGTLDRETEVYTSGVFCRRASFNDTSHISLPSEYVLKML